MGKTRWSLLTVVAGTAVLMAGCDLANTPSAKTEHSDVVELRVSGYKAGSEIGAIPEINELFMKEYPGIRVVYESMPGVQYSKYIKGRFAVNDAPDVLMLHPGVEEVGGYSKSGFIRDLSDEPWVERFTPESLKAVSIDGKVYGTPNDKVALGVYYNKDLFRKLSLKTPDNWEELVASCARLKEAGYTPISIGNNDGWMTLAALFAMGSTLLDDPDYDRKVNERTVKFNGTWNEMAEMWYGLNDRGYLTPDSTSVSLEQAQKAFTDGKAGMIVNGSWALEGMLRAKPNFKIGMFAMPAGYDAEETIATVAVGTTWAISGKTERLDAARKYLEFWSRKDTLRKWAKSQGAFLTLQGEISVVPEELNEMFGLVETGRTKDYLSERWNQSGAMNAALMDSSQGVYLDALSIEDMLTNMDNAWDQASSQGGGFR